jgi:hypothetical protein
VGSPFDEQAAGAGEPGKSTSSRRPGAYAVPFSHLAVEFGHLCMEDFLAGRESLTRQFEQVRPWVTAAGEAAAQRARISTCFLVDDYFTRFSTPVR